MRRITFLSALILIFLIPWEDSVSTQSLGSLARVAGIFVAGLWLGTIILKGKFRSPGLFHALALLFFLWNAASIFWSRDKTTTISRIETYCQMFLLISICWDLFQKRAELLAGVQAYVLGAYVLVGSTVYNYLAGNVAVAYEGRYSATGVNANDVALNLVLGLPMAMMLFLAQTKGSRMALQRAVNFLYIPLALFAIILTGTRTSILATIPFAIFMVGTRHIQLERKMLLFAVLLICLVALFPLVPQSVIDRLATVGSSIAQQDLGGRTAMWRSSIAVLAEHPILGIGAGAVDGAIGGAVHNTLLAVFTETGVIGVLVFLAMLGLSVHALSRIAGKTSSLWQTIFFTWAIGVLSLSWEFRKLTWILLSFILIASHCGEEEAEAESSPIQSTPSPGFQYVNPRPPGGQ